MMGQNGVRASVVEQLGLKIDHTKNLIPLDSDKIKSYVKEMGNDRLSDDTLSRNLDLTREFRSKDYPLIHLLLQNPLAELISMSVPNPTAAAAAEEDPKSIPGYLYLFDGSVPIDSRREDNVLWTDCKKMSVKLIIYNESTEMYKLKNNKNDEGVVVMRRQTWRGEKKHSGWRRNEYKLVVRETYFKQSQDGRLTITEGQSLQEFPVLVHYFWKNEAMLNRNKRKRTASGASRRGSGTVLTHSSNGDNVFDGPFDSSSQITQYAAVQPPQKRTHYDTQSSPEQPEQMMYQSTPAATQRQLNDSGSNITTTNNNTINLTNSNNNNNNNSNANQQQNMMQSENDVIMAILNQNPPPIRNTAANPMRAQQHNHNTNYPIDYEKLQYMVKSEAADVEFGDDLFRFKSRVETGQIVPYTAMETKKEGGPAVIEIASYAPESGPSTEPTKILLALSSSVPHFQQMQLKYSCVFEEVVIPAKEIGPRMIECQAPPHKAGIVYFWVSCSDDREMIFASKPVPFYYTPVDNDGKLSLAWELIGNTNLAATMVHFKHTVRELDLTHNDLGTISFLEGFKELNSLILDHNHITHSEKFPHLPKLHTLCINHNWLMDIEKFLDNLVDSVPSLRYLSTLHNAASPFFSNAKHHYYNYRIYILSRLRNLTHLDSSPVTMEEWRHAACIIPDNSTTASNIEQLVQFISDDEIKLEDL